jgi:hypothetical protein
MSFHPVNTGDGAAQTLAQLNVYDIVKRPKSALGAI